MKKLHIFIIINFFSITLIGQVPNVVLSPVKGTLTTSKTGCTPTTEHWCFYQWGANGCSSSCTHDSDGGIGSADDTYAWDANLTPDYDNGKPVYSIADGVIDETIPNWGGLSYGQVLIKHTEANGDIWYSGFVHLRDVYGNLITANTFQNGQIIKAGQQIGVISSTGITNNHLHFAVYKWDNKLVSQDAMILENALQVNFGQLINFGHTANPQSRKIYFEIPDHLAPINSPITSINTVRNVRIGNNDSTPYVRFEKTAHYVSGSNNLFYFEIDDLPSNYYPNFQYFDIQFEIIAGAETINAHGNKLVYFVGSGADFLDIAASHQIADYLDINAKYGLLEGGYNDIFSGTEGMGRGYASRIICNAALRLDIIEELDLSGNYFPDVPPGHPDFPQIQTLKNKGIISGYGDGTFRPANAVTYGGFCKIMVESLFRGSNGVALPRMDELFARFQPYFYNVVCANGQSCDLANYVGEVEVGLSLLNYPSIEEIASNFLVPEKMAVFEERYQGTTALDINAEETIKRKETVIVLAKAYETVVNLRNINFNNGGQQRMMQLFSEQSIIGSKLNLTSNPTSADMPPPTEYERIMLSEQRDTLDFGTEVDNNGNGLVFYWHSDGGILEQRFPDSYRAVIFTAPIVTEPTLIHLYVWLGNTAGNTDHGIINILVYPEGYGEDPICGNLQCDGTETCLTCPGDCGTCPTCYDGIQNGDETSTDCGGSNCPPCANCGDGVRNGTEIGIDCGGSTCPPCAGNNLVEMEYFIDDDPGIGLGQSVNISNSFNIYTNFNVNLDGVSIGYHVLFIRVKDNEGIWSFPQPHPFMVGIQDGTKHNIHQLEYFFNDDPGVGQGTAVAVNQVADITHNWTADLSTLSPGYHNMNIRAQDGSGVWSMPVTHDFFLANGTGTSDDIDYWEYFFDTDPSIGFGAALPAVSGADVGDLYNLDISGLSEGIHTLYVRARTTKGFWSFTQQKVFLVQPANANQSDIVELEYYIDNEPGIGLATLWDGFVPALDIMSNIQVDLTGLVDGTSHYLYVRAKNEREVWGSPAVHPFLIDENPLVIEGLDFSAHRKNKEVLLNWKTTNEIDNEGFEIERSADGSIWDKIGWEAGKGITNGDTYYQLTDKTPFVGVNYYRLKQFDFNGNFAYSPIRMVIMDKEDGAVLVFPNPTRRMVQVVNRSADALTGLRLCDMQGRLLRTFEIGQEEMLLDLGDLANGVYYLGIEKGDGKQWEKIVVQQ